MAEDSGKGGGVSQYANWLEAAEVRKSSSFEGAGALFYILIFFVVV